MRWFVVEIQRLQVLTVDLDAVQKGPAIVLIFSAQGHSVQHIQVFEHFFVFVDEASLTEFWAKAVEQALGKEVVLQIRV